MVRPRTVLTLSKVDGQRSETIATQNGGSTSTGGDVVKSSSPSSPVDKSVVTDCQKSINSRDKESTGSSLRRSDEEEQRTMLHSYRSEEYSQYQGSSRGCLNENQREDLAIFHTRLQCQPTLPSVITTRDTRQSNQTETRHSVPIYDGKKGITDVHKIQRLLAAQPNVFSQTIPAREVIVRAYATRSHKPAGGAVRMETQREFKWTDVFPVVKQNSENGTIGEKVMNGQDEEESTKAVVLPKLATKNGRRVTEDYPGFCTTSLTEEPGGTL